jgi:hypothetical protein
MIHAIREENGKATRAAKLGKTKQVAKHAETAKELGKAYEKHVRGF